MVPVAGLIACRVGVVANVSERPARAEGQHRLRLNELLNVSKHDLASAVQRFSALVIRQHHRL